MENLLTVHQKKLATKQSKKGKQKKEQPLKVVYISNPVKVKTSASEFRSLVQRLTGRHADSVHHFDNLRRVGGDEYDNDLNLVIDGHQMEAEEAAAAAAEEEKEKEEQVQIISAAAEETVHKSGGGSISESGNGSTSDLSMFDHEIYGDVVEVADVYHLDKCLLEFSDSSNFWYE